MFTASFFGFEEGYELMHLRGAKGNFLLNFCSGCGLIFESHLFDDSNIRKWCTA